MRKTLILCFIHGFKGGEDTFGNFPEELRAQVNAALPDIDVQSMVYPKYETRGELGEAVNRLREWLLEKVIDIEVANGTPSPTIDPSVHTILIGHSMGGIVAVETVLALCSDKLVGQDESEESALMFPFIQGVLAFDTPYLGISPGVVAHNAENHYKTASSAISTLSQVSNIIWGSSTPPSDKSLPALPAPPSAAASSSSWAKWGKMAAYAGAAGAVAAGSAVAYLKKDEITEGWMWVGSHLAFVGCLMKGEEMKKRVEKMITLNQNQSIGYANFFTELGKGAKAPPGINISGTVMGQQRTFCNLPKSKVMEYFHPALNDSASDEIMAHISMFVAKDNTGYQMLLDEAKSSIVRWTKNEWYENSKPEPEAIEMALQQ